MLCDYFFQSKRLGFRRWQLNDLGLAQQLWGNPEVTKLFSRDPFSPEQIYERLHSELERDLRYGLQYWPCFQIASDEFIGCCGLRPYRSDEKIAELGFHLSPTHWGKGYATEAALAVIEYAEQNLELQALFAGHHPENLASRRVLLKLGFEESGSELYEPTGLLHPGYLLKLSSDRKFCKKST